MGFIGDLFKKKKEERHYDPNNITITDLERNFVFDYEMQTWQVTEVYEYDWGNNFFTREYKIDSGSQTAFLSIEEDDGIFAIVSQKLKIRAIEENLPETIIKNEAPPAKIKYDGVEYLKDSESPGYFKNLSDTSDNWAEFISWDYYDRTEKLTLCIEQWGESEFEASIGKIVQIHEFSNILPA